MAEVVSTNQFRNGMHIELDGQTWRIVDFQHVKPGKGGAFVRTKLKALSNGAVVDRTFRAGEKFARIRTETTNVQYLYDTGDEVVFMDEATFEQVSLPHADVEDVLPFLLPSSSVQVLLVDGAPTGIDLPSSVILEVAETEPGVKGDTVSNVMKAATLETGAVVQVPLFVNVGDKLKIDPRENGATSVARSAGGLEAELGHRAPRAVERKRRRLVVLGVVAPVGTPAALGRRRALRAALDADDAEANRHARSMCGSSRPPLAVRRGRIRSNDCSMPSGSEPPAVARGIVTPSATATIRLSASASASIGSRASCGRIAVPKPSAMPCEPSVSSMSSPLPPVPLRRRPGAHHQAAQLVLAGAVVRNSTARSPRAGG